jgi:hypothetical protein
MKRDILVVIAVAGVVGCAAASDNGVDQPKGAPPSAADAGTSDSHAIEASHADATGTTAPAPSCSDGLKNGLETDVDCGGNCPLCDRGGQCKSAEDCGSSICSDGLCCVESAYQKSSGYQYSGYTICCEGEDERTGVTDCGDGESHSATASGTNCAQAFEDSDNNGGPCASVTCKRFDCSPPTVDAGVEASTPK